MRTQVLSAAIAVLTLGTTLVPAQAQAQQQELPKCQSKNSVFVVAQNKNEAFGRKDYGERAVTRMDLNWRITVRFCMEGQKLAVEAVGFEKAFADLDERNYKMQQFAQQAMWNMPLLPY